MNPSYLLILFFFCKISFLLRSTAWDKQNRNTNLFFTPSVLVNQDFVHSSHLFIFFLIGFLNIKCRHISAIVQEKRVNVPNSSSLMSLSVPKKNSKTNLLIIKSNFWRVYKLSPTPTQSSAVVLPRRIYTVHSCIYNSGYVT